MIAYTVKRAISGAVVIALVSMSVYALFWFGPRNPAAPLCQQDLKIRCTKQALERYTEELGYNDSVVHQYGLWVKGIFVGRDIDLGADVYHCKAPCLGIDYRTKRPVTEEFAERLPATVSLAVGGSVLYLVAGVGVGIMAARRRGSLADRLLVSGTLVMSSVPYYLLALLAYIYLIVELDLFSGTGYHSPLVSPWSWFAGMALPWLVLGLYGSTAYTRFSRGSMVEALGEDYIRTARSKGLTERTVVMKHALRAAVVPVVTIFGLDVATLLAGTIFTEQIFGIDGVGHWGLNATYQRNLPVVSAVVLLGAVAVVVANLAVDVVYSLLDPRVRLS